VACSVGLSPRDECLGLVDVGRAERAKLGHLEALELGQVALLNGSKSDKTLNVRNHVNLIGSSD